jgi:putative flippase GtrA
LKNKLLWQIVRFLIAAGLGSVLYIVVLLFLTEVIHFWYLGSVIVARIINSIINFIIQKYWAFNNRKDSRIKQQLWPYVQISTLLLAVTILGMYVLVDIVGVHYLVAQVLLMPPQAFLSFILTRWVFRRKQAI